jgi:hypothetical protein
MYTNVNGRVVECEHKYVLKRTESYWRRTARFCKEYVLIDYYFCEKCLYEQNVKKRQELLDAEDHKLEDWARAITNHVKDVDYSW